MNRSLRDRRVAALLLWSALAALAAPARAAPIDVVAWGPELACPDRVAVQEALFAQVGDGAAASGWRLIYRSADELQGNLLLELTDDRGQSRLRRQVRIEGGDCRARAEAIALIVYRFFAQLGGSGSLPAAQEIPSPPARISPTPAPLRASATAPPAARLRLSIEAGGGLWSRRPQSATSVLGLRLAWRNVEAAFSVLAPRAPAAERPADGGVVEGSALGMAFSLGLTWEDGRVRLHGGPMSIVCLESARTRGIAIAGENAGTTAALGLAAGASWRLGRGFRLGFEAGLGHALLGNRFVVGGWGPVLAPPAWQAIVLARLGYTFSP